MEWTDELISELRKLWFEGLSTAEIGRKLSLTKNAIVGKAHRLGLPKRPSPIKREKNPQVKAEENKLPEKAKSPAKRAPKTAPKTAPKSEDVKPASKKDKAGDVQAPAKRVRKRKKEKPSYESVAGSSADGASKGARSEGSASGVREALINTGKDVADATAAKKRRSAAGGCQWPVGDPGASDFHYCEEPTFDGKPYCLEHCAIAYVRLRERR